MPTKVDPTIKSLLSSIQDTLNNDFRLRVSEISVLKDENRAYSKIWLLKTDSNNQYFLKYSSSGLNREYELTRHTCELFEDNRRVMKPTVFFQPNSKTFLVEKLPGCALSETCGRLPIVKHFSWFREQRKAIREAGSWLAKFHSSLECDGQSVSKGLKEYVHRREETLQILGQNIRKKLYALLDLPSKGSSVKIHGDFSPHNIIVSPEGIGVIDFAGIAEFDISSPWFDVATMVVGLQSFWYQNLLGFLYPLPRLLRRFEEAFFQGYGKTPANDSIYGLCVCIRHLSALHSLYRRGNGNILKAKWHLRRLNSSLSSLSR